VTFLPASAAEDLAADVTADLVVMVVAAGTDGGEVATIGEACSRSRVPTATLVIRGGSASEADVSKTLAHVRPWSLMVVIASDDNFVEDLLQSFR
jgi:hypothetical protein